MDQEMLQGGNQGRAGVEAALCPGRGPREAAAHSSLARKARHYREQKEQGCVRRKGVLERPEV